MINRNTNVSAVMFCPFIGGSRLSSSEHENHSQTFATALLPVRCRDHLDALTTAHADPSMAVAARLLEPDLCVIHEFSRVLTRPVTLGKPSPFPLAFSVVLLASSEARRNFSGRVLHSVALGLPLGALAAAPGCMKMLRIFSSRLPGLVVVGCSSPLRGRASRGAERRSNPTLSFSVFPLPSTPDVLSNSARRMTGIQLGPQPKQPPEERWPTARRKLKWSAYGNDSHI
jgi:hypothetical protein